MPTWPSPSKNTRTPGSSPSRGTGVPIPYCAAALCGSDTPSRQYTYMTSPEQSKPDGDAPPHTYGTPRYCSAIATAWPPSVLDGRPGLLPPVLPPTLLPPLAAAAAAVAAACSRACCWSIRCWMSALICDLRACSECRPASTCCLAASCAC